MSWLLPLPWGSLTDPLWLTVGNVLFWPLFAAYVIGRDRYERWQRIRSRQRIAD